MCSEHPRKHFNFGIRVDRLSLSYNYIAPGPLRCTVSASKRLFPSASELMAQLMNPTRCRSCGLLRLRLSQPRRAVGLVRPVHAELPKKPDPAQPPSEQPSQTAAVGSPKTSDGLGKFLLLGVMFAGWCVRALMSESLRCLPMPRCSHSIATWDAFMIEDHPRLLQVCV